MWKYASSKKLLPVMAMGAMLGLSACGVLQQGGGQGPVDLKQARFADLKNWDKDQHGQALQAFKISCEKDLLKKSAQTGLGPRRPDGTYLAGIAQDWREPCQSAVLMVDQATELNDKEAKAFFEQWFSPWQVRGGSSAKGLFTGYFEPRLTGSRTQQRSYQTPLLAKPDDLVMVDLGQFRDDLSGRRIAGRVIDGRLYPYEDRAAIEAGKLPAESFKPIVWVDDPVDAFFLHIQGSGQVVLEDETIVRVGYAGQNGHPYYAVGRELVKRGVLKKDEVTLETIQDWLHANPTHLHDVLNTNKSYVFFSELNGPGPLGAEGVPLTPGRSLAVDYTKLPYGAPIWVDTAPPAKDYPPLQRLMVAQDTGGAIRGAVRGDVFWGAGVKPKFLAGHMKSEGQKWILLPKSVAYQKPKS